MQLQAVEFEKYKAFSDRQRVELKPITLFFGHNSVGKSAALRALPNLAAAALAPRHDAAVPSIFDYTAPSMRGATFEDMITRGTTRSAASQYALEWEGLRYEFTVRYAGPLEGEFLSGFTLIDGTGSRSGVREDSDHGRNVFRIEGYSELFGFDGLLPYALGEGALPEALMKLKKLLLDFGKQVFWLQSVRTRPPRVYQFGAGTKLQIEPDGTGAAQVLRRSSHVNDGVADAVSKWLKQACDCELSFADTAQNVVADRLSYPLNLRTKSGSEVSILEVGEGISQALPVLALCHQALRGKLGASPILAIEQPELHLHPRAAVQLASEIVSCVEKKSPAVHVIETHSESILLAIQQAIVTSRLSPDQVSVYWVEQNVSASMNLVEFDDRGYPSDAWPSGIFRENLEQARALAALRAKS
jgi:hypothetical protein